MNVPLDLNAVILNYNGGSLLREVVEPVAVSRQVRVGIVLADNGSSDGSLDALQRDPLPYRQFGAEVPLVALRVNKREKWAHGHSWCRVGATRQSRAARIAGIPGKRTSARVIGPAIPQRAWPSGPAVYRPFPCTNCAHEPLFHACSHAGVRYGLTEQEQ